jgi:hypothetical protein
MVSESMASWLDYSGPMVRQCIMVAESLWQRLFTSMKREREREGGKG